MPALILKFWREIFIILLSLSLVLVYLWKDRQVQSATMELNQYKSGLEFQNAVVLENAKKLEKKAKELPKVIEKIKTRYEVIYADIDNFKGDENATDCANALTFLNDFNY